MIVAQGAARGGEYMQSIDGGQRLLLMSQNNKRAGTYGWGRNPPAAHMSLCHIIGKAANGHMHDVCLQGRSSGKENKLTKCSKQRGEER